MQYSFDIEHATKYGVDEAVFLQNLIFWLRANKANRVNLHPVTVDGKEESRTWTYNTLDAFAQLFPFWNRDKIHRIGKSLEAQGVILKGNYNAKAYDFTVWYALRDESLLSLTMEKPIAELQHAHCETAMTIPDINSDPKQERERGEGEQALARETRTSRSEPSSSPLSLSLREKMKKEAGEKGTLIPNTSDFNSSLLELAKIASEPAILRAWSRMLDTRPDKARFFCDDYSRYTRELNDASAKSITTAVGANARGEVPVSAPVVDLMATLAAEMGTEAERNAAVERAKTALPWNAAPAKVRTRAELDRQARELVRVSA